MDLHIEDKKFPFWDFPEKLSHLKKKNEIDIDVSVYIYDNQTKPNSDLEFFKSLTELPNIIYVSKSMYYYWVFSECKLLNISFSEDKNFIDYQGRDIKKFDIKFSISYKDVWGSNNKSVIDRDIKLNKLFNK